MKGEFNESKLLSLGFVREINWAGEEIYIKGDFFGILEDDGTLDYRSREKEGTPLQIVSNVLEMREAEKEYYLEKREELVVKLGTLTLYLENEYGWKKGDV